MESAKQRIERRDPLRHDTALRQRAHRRDQHCVENDRVLARLEHLVRVERTHERLYLRTPTRSRPYEHRFY